MSTRLIPKWSERAISLGLAAVMALGSGPAMAAPSSITAGPNDKPIVDGAGSVPVELTAEAATFDVTVPTLLPIYVDADGIVYTATDAQIINHSYGPANVADLDIEAKAPWQTVDYASFNVAKEKVGSTKFGMEINSEVTTGPDAITFSPANWDPIPGNNSPMNYLALPYDAKVAPQAEETTETIASVVFTIGWDKESVSIRTLKDLAVGESVWLEENGEQVEFLVVNQGNPDTVKYPDSCNGTWILRKDCVTKMAWDATCRNAYAYSDITDCTHGQAQGVL